MHGLIRLISLVLAGINTGAAGEREAAVVQDVLGPGFIC